MSSYKKNDWIAINLNAPENFSEDQLYNYGITPDNTTLESEDFYKSKKQIQNSELFKDTAGNFDPEKFHAFYESAKRSYVRYSQADFTSKLIDEIESSPYDIFSLGNSNVADTSAAIYNSRDPQRTTMGLGNLYEVGSPTFDVREVAQANKARDEYGNVLDWTPNEKGGFIKGFLRPAMVLATYDEDGSHLENGRLIQHRKGDLKVDEFGDPYYEKLGNREMYNKELLHYWDTITKDDSAWNKFDFMDSDGLNKSFGGIAMKTAVSLIPYFHPTIGPILGYVGAVHALSKFLPVLSKGIDGIIMGSVDNKFGKTMTSIENWVAKFDTSTSRNVMGKFLSAENIGDIIATSAGQLFQQRQMGNLAPKIFKHKDLMTQSKIGRQLAIGYMVGTSSTEAYSIFKRAGASDAAAGVGLLGVMSGFAILMNSNYFKNAVISNTFMDEDMVMRQTIKEIVEDSTLEPFATYQKAIPKATSELAKRWHTTRLYKAVEKNIVKKGKEWIAKMKEPPNSVAMTEKAAEGASKGVGFQMRTSMYLSRALNEGLEETMEEVMQDANKVIALGLESLGINMTKDPNEKLDFGLTWKDAFTRYLSSAIGGAIGGAVFEGFNHWEGGQYDSLLEKDLDERLTWYIRNNYDGEIRKRIDALYKKGKLGNVNLSATPSKMKQVDGKDMIVYDKGTDTDNQNLFTYNAINFKLDMLRDALEDNNLFLSDNAIFKKIYDKLKEEIPDEEDPRKLLYHFLDTIDKAKALTVIQMGFINAFKEDATKLSSDILILDKQIKDKIEKIRTQNKILDGQEEKLRKLVDDNDYIKEKRKEKKEKEKTWKQMLDGNMNGYYMGYGHFMANPVYENLYTNPSFSPFQDDAFIRSSIENWSLYTRGINYKNIKDEDLKKEIDEEFRTVQEVFDSNESMNDKDALATFKSKSRKLYDIHMRIGQKFGKDITEGAKKVKSSQVVDENQYVGNLFYEALKDTNVVNIRDAAVELKRLLDAAKTYPDEWVKSEAQNKGIDAFIKSLFEEPGIDRTDLIMTLIKVINEKAVNENLDIDTHYYQRKLLRPLLENHWLKKKDATPDVSIFDKKSEEFEEKLPNSSVEEIQEYIKNYSDEEIENDPDLKEAIEIFNESSDPSGIIEKTADYERQKHFLWNINQDADGRTSVLLNKLLDLVNSLSLDHSNLKRKYTDFVSFLMENGGLTEKEAIDYIDSQVSPGSSLISFVIDQQNLTKNLLYDPIVELLSKFGLYAGEDFYTIMDILTDEEAYQSALSDPQKYTISNQAKKDKLIKAIAFLNVVAAAITSATDGLNESVNLSNENEDLAVLDPSLSEYYRARLSTIRRRIHSLLDTSSKNELRTTTAQKETFIYVNTNRIKQLVELGEITFEEFPDEKIDFKQIWEDTGYVMNNASIEDAAKFEEAISKFNDEVSKKIHKIRILHWQNNKQTEFYKALVDRFGNDVYTIDPGEISNEPEAKLPPYALVKYLLNCSILNSETFASLWKSVTERYPELIPLYGQEFAVNEIVSYVIDFKDKSGVIDGFHQYLKDSFPKNQLDPEHNTQTWSEEEQKYLDAREVLERYIHTDGIAGVGKTEGVDFLALECLKEYYENDVSASAYSVEQSTAEKLHTALRLGEDNVKPKTFKKLLEELYTDADGKVLFDINTCYTLDKEQPIPKFKMKDGVIVDEDGRSMLNYNKDKAAALFNDSAHLKVLFFDESCLMNYVEIKVLSELAKSLDFVIIGSGDSLQNVASLGNTTSGIEDAIYNRAPALTISMRSENSGVSKNVNKIRDILFKVNKARLFRPGIMSTDMDKVFSKILDDSRGDTANIELIYSEKGHEGHELIMPSGITPIAKEMLDLIKKSNETDTTGRKHQLAIITDDEGKQNSYRTEYKDYGDSVVVIDSKAVQGKEYDFVIVDIDFNKTSKYLRLRSLYTMMTRARIGAAIVDKDNLIKDLFIDSKKDNSAAEPVLGGDPETKHAIFDEYTKWRRALMEHHPNFERPTETEEKSESESKSESSSNGSEDGTDIETPTHEIKTYGVNEEDRTKIEENPLAYYIERLRNKNGYLSKVLKHREEVSTNFSFDDYIAELKSNDSKILDKVQGVPKLRSSGTYEFKVVLSIIARGILNNKTSQDRKNYFVNAKDLLNTRLRAACEGNIGTFLTSLQGSFDDGVESYFFCDEEYIYYSFLDGSNPVIVPIIKHNRKDLNGKIYKNLTFKIETGAIPVTSEGEYFSSLENIVSEIDGIVTDKNGNNEGSIGIVNFNKALVDKIVEIWDKYNNAGNDVPKELKQAVSALSFLKRNSGKAFLTLISAASEFLSQEDVYKILTASYGTDNTIPIAAFNKEYNPTELVQTLQSFGIQRLIDFREWWKIQRFFKNLISKGKDANLDDAEACKFFELTPGSILNDFNDASNESVKNSPLKKLGKYKMLNETAINNLSAALFRYLAQNPNKPWKRRFYQNFLLWMNWKKTDAAKDDFVHRRGFNISFETKTGKDVIKHFLSIVPNLESNQNANGSYNVLSKGYSIFYANNEDPRFKLVHSSNEEMGNLFGTEFDVVKAINEVLNKVNDSTLEDGKLVKQIIKDWSTEDKNDMISSGKLIISPVDFYSKPTGDGQYTPAKIYSPFEADVYRWLTQKWEDGVWADANDIDDANELTAIEKFLKNDTIFKYGLYRHIGGEAQSTEGTLNDAWKISSMAKLKEKGFVTDIVGILQPMYTPEAGATNVENGDSNLWNTIHTFVAKNTSQSSDSPSINISDAFKLQDITLSKFKILDSLQPVVNIPWLKKYVQSNQEWDTSKEYKITGFDYFKETVLINDEEYSIKDLNSFVNNLGLTERIEDRSFTTKEGHTVFPLDNKILIKDDTSTSTKTFNGKFLGVVNGTYYFKVNNNSENQDYFGVELLNSDQLKLFKIDNIDFPSGEFEGIGIVAQQDDIKIVYRWLKNDGSELYIIKSSIDDEPWNITSEDLSGAQSNPPEFVNIPIDSKSRDLELKDMSMYKSKFNDYYIISGNRVISRDVLESIVENPDVLIEGDSFILLSYNESEELEYADVNDLHKGGLVKTNGNFKIRKLGNPTVSEFDNIINLLFENMTESPNSIRLSITEEIENRNSKQKEEFHRLDSNLQNLKVLEFNSGNLLTREIDSKYVFEDNVSVFQRRAIYNGLSNEDKNNIKRIYRADENFSSTSPIVVEMYNEELRYFHVFEDGTTKPLTRREFNEEMQESLSIEDGLKLWVKEYNDLGKELNEQHTSEEQRNLQRLQDIATLMKNFYENWQDDIDFINLNVTLNSLFKTDEDSYVHNRINLSKKDVFDAIRQVIRIKNTNRNNCD